MRLCATFDSTGLVRVDFVSDPQQSSQVHHFWKLARPIIEECGQNIARVMHEHDGETGVDDNLREEVGDGTG